MDIVPSICLSSLAGAIFFFTGGRLSARGPQAAGGEELSAERAARARVEEEMARTAAARDEATRARDDAARAHGEATRALAAEQGRVMAQARALENERASRSQEAQRAAAEMARLGEEGARLRAHATGLAQQIAEMQARVAADAGTVRAQMMVAPDDGRAAAAEKRAVALAAELEKARAELAQTLEAKGRIGAEVADLKARLAQRGEAAGEARREAEATTARRVAEMQKEIEQARSERAAARTQLDQTRTQLNQARAALTAAETRATAAEKRAADADRLRAENAELRAAKAAPAAADLADLQRRGVELASKARVIEQRTGELERANAENAELRIRLETLTEAARESDALRRRVAELEAMGFAKRLEEPPPPSRPTPEGARLSTVLERELDRLVSREEGCRMAVLADPRGLLIAASAGASYPHEVAAASSLTTSTSDRLRELMPLGAPSSLEIYDENGLCMRTRWIRFEKEWFLVSTVGMVDPHDTEAADLRSRLGELIGR